MLRVCLRGVKSTALIRKVAGGLPRAATPTCAVAMQRTGSFSMMKRMFSSDKIKFDEILALRKYAEMKLAEKGGVVDSEIGDILFNLGNALRTTDMTGAAALYEKAVEIYRTTAGETHLDRGEALHHLGMACKNLEQFEKAMKCFDEALQIFSKNPGTGRQECRTLNAMGEILAENKQELDLAIKLFEKALKKGQEAEGENGVGTIRSLNGLAFSYLALANFGQAEEVLHRQLAAELNTYGQTHEIVTLTLGRLGAVQLSLGNFSSAVASLEKSVASPAAATIQPSAKFPLFVSLGTAYLESDNGEKAVAILQQALDLGEKHPQSAALQFETERQMGMALMRTHRVEEASAMFDRALNTWNRMGTKDDDRVFDMKIHQGALLMAQNRPAEGIAKFEALVKSISASRGKSDPMVARVTRMVALGHLYYETPEARVKALKILESALKILTGFFNGEKHATVVEILNDIGDVHIQLGDLSLANQFFDRAAKIEKELPGMNLVKGYMRQAGQLAANRYFVEAVRRFEMGAAQTPVQELPGILFAFTGTLANQFEQFDKAIALLEKYLEMVSSTGTEAATYLHSTIGRYHEFEGRNDTALEWYKRALSLCPPESIAAVDMTANIAEAYRRKGELDESIGKFEEAREMLRVGTGGAQSVPMGNLLQMIGETYCQKGEPETAMTFFNQALREYQAFPEDSHEFVACTFFHMGQASEALGEIGPAQLLYERAVAIYEKKVPAEKRVMYQQCKWCLERLAENKIK